MIAVLQDVERSLREELLVAGELCHLQSVAELVEVDFHFVDFDVGFHVAVAVADVE